jgi:hypothetical protein
MTGRLQGDKLSLCNSQAVEEQIRAHKEIARNLGVNATPLFVVDGQVVQGADMPSWSGFWKQSLIIGRYCFFPVDTTGWETVYYGKKMGESPSMTAAEYFSNVPLFQCLPLEDRRHLFASTRREHLKKGDVLFRKGSEGTALYVIHQGKIKISATSPAGDEVILAIFSDGDYFGEMSLLDGMPRSADATAIEPSELFALNQSDFNAFPSNSTPTRCRPS